MLQSVIAVPRPTATDTLAAIYALARQRARELQPPAPTASEQAESEAADDGEHE